MVVDNVKDRETYINSSISRTVNVLCCKVSTLQTGRIRIIAIWENLPATLAGGIIRRHKGKKNKRARQDFRQ
jgi:hypothetical protein